MRDKPNIVWFVADQMRSDALGCNGNPAAMTPVMNELAEEGVSFTNAFSQNPVCVPSRCSFLSGLYPHVRGHRSMHHLLEPGEPTLLVAMRDAGYEVIWAGRNDLVPGNRPKTPYCDHYFNGKDLADHADDEDSRISFGNLATKKLEATPAPVMDDLDLTYSFYRGSLPAHAQDDSFDDLTVDAAISCLERRNDERPFFLYVTLADPHPPYVCEEPFFSSISRDALPPRRPDIERCAGKASMLTRIRERQKMTGWSESQYDELRATYLAQVARFDWNLGRLVGALRRLDLYDESALFVFSDHGDYTGDYGLAEKNQNTFEDPLVNVPLIVRPPVGAACRPGLNDELVQLLDLPATVADLAGIDLGYEQFGRSLLGAVAGEPGPRDAVFAEGGRLPGERQGMELLHGPESPYWPRNSVQHESDVAHGKASMIRTRRLKYVMRLTEPDELYDLERDPMETTNIIDDASYAGELAELRQRLLRHHVETSDWLPRRLDPR